jgi:hypothetical protein
MLAQETDFGHENIVFCLNYVLKKLQKDIHQIENDVCLCILLVLSMLVD